MEEKCKRTGILPSFFGLCRNGKMSTVSSMSSLHASVDFIPVVDQNPITDAAEEEEEDEDVNKSFSANSKSIKGVESGDCNGEVGGFRDTWGARHSMVCLATLGVILVQMMRNNLSIAIVAMVGKTGPTMNENATWNGSVSPSDTCPVPDNQDEGTHGIHVQTGEFDWDERTQGMVLGAYFYGNVVMNLIGGRVAEYVGGKLIFGLGIFLSAVTTLLSPVAAQTSTQLFVAVRLFTGAAHGLVMPAITRCLVTWIPPMERSKFNTVVFSGAEVGTVTSLSVGGYLCGMSFLGGWPLVFYVFGLLGVVWSLLWFLLVTENPESHPRISEAEREYILFHCKVKRGKPISVPWLAVLTSVPLWSVFIMHVGHNWAYYTFLTLLPSYFSNIQHFELKSNGLLSALPYTIKWLFALSYGFVMNKLLASDKLSAISVRRISMIVGSYIPSIGLVFLTMAGCNQALSVAILVISMAFCGATFCGFFCSHQDLSPNLAGTTYGISNFLANSTGFIAPSVAGAILLNNQTVGAWNTVFFISAGVYSAACTFYVTFISTDVQPFNNPKNNAKYHDGEDEKLKGPNKC